MGAKINHKNYEETLGGVGLFGLFCISIMAAVTQPQHLSKHRILH